MFSMVPYMAFFTYMFSVDLLNNPVRQTFLRLLSFFLNYVMHSSVLGFFCLFFVFF